MSASAASARGAKIGILALQGSTRLHTGALAELGAHPVTVRTPGELAGVDGLVIPGGESTTVSLLVDSSQLRPALEEALAGGLPVFGTCAGMIVCAAEVVGGRPDQRGLGAIDVAVRRNAFGRQRESFEADLDIDGLLGGPFPGVFIRAPVVERVGPDVEVLARLDGVPVCCRSGSVLISAFHPELGADLRVHQLFLERI